MFKKLFKRKKEPEFKPDFKLPSDRFMGLKKFLLLLVLLLKFSSIGCFALGIGFGVMGAGGVTPKILAEKVLKVFLGGAPSAIELGEMSKKGGGVDSVASSSPLGATLDDESFKASLDEQSSTEADLYGYIRGGKALPQEGAEGEESEQEGEEQGGEGAADNAMGDALAALTKGGSGQGADALGGSSQLGNMGFKGAGGASGGFSSGGSGPKAGKSRASGKASMGSAGGASSRRGKGKIGRSRKAGTKTVGRFNNRGAGAYGNLKGAAKLSNRGYGASDQVAAGASGAAFGQAPNVASIVAGGPSAEVSGTPEGDPGMDTIDSGLGDPADFTQPTAINPNNTAAPIEEEENPLQDLMMEALTWIVAALALAFIAAFIPNGWPAILAKIAFGAAALVCLSKAYEPISKIFGDDTLGMQGMMMGALLAGVGLWTAAFAIKSMFTSLSPSDLTKAGGIKELLMLNAGSGSAFMGAATVAGGTGGLAAGAGAAAAGGGAAAAATSGD
ncbi:hypothetical protein ACFL6Y_11000 [Elusimicrobiota bacterium]